MQLFRFVRFLSVGCCLALLACLSPLSELPVRKAPAPTPTPPSTTTPGPGSVGTPVDGDTCTSAAESRLIQLIMQYRRQKGLPAIPVSPALQKVARLHARDLQASRPAGKCNMHSWSRNGSWTPCCYTRDHKQARCMWQKPQELSAYRGYGFEISYAHSAAARPEGALAGWKRSSGHNSVMINAGRWNKPWRAIGAGIYGSYAVVWFGREADSAGIARSCAL